MILTVGEGKEFRAIGAAIDAAAAGDTVHVYDGVYRESVTVNKAITLRAAPDATPIIDGGWNGKTTGGGFGGQLSATAAGAVLDGLTVRNAPGRGIGVGASNVTVRNCTVMDCYKGGFGANPAAGQTYTGLLIENNLIMRVGLERFTSGGTVNGSFLFTDVVDSVFVGNIIANGMGEGINIDRNSRGNVIEHNLIINCAHVGIYINCAQDNIVRSNTVIWSGAAKPVSGKNETAPAGIIIGDEGPASKKFSPSRGNIITGNLVVGSGRLFQVRNNAANYNTQLDTATRIERNTFVAGPQTERGIDIAANVRGRPHEAAVFADNVIDWTGAPAGAVIASRADAALDFRGNVWGATPTQDVRGPGDVVATGPLLVNPTAALHPEWDTVDVGFSVDNYRPIAGSAADGKGALTAMEPDTPEPPEPPEPTGPDYAPIIALLENNLARLEDAGLAVGAAIVDTHELIDRLKAGESL